MSVNGFVVVDASLPVKWLVEEDDSDKAHTVLQSWVVQDKRVRCAGAVRRATMNHIVVKLKLYLRLPRVIKE